MLCIAYATADIGLGVRSNQYLPPNKGYNYDAPNVPFGSVQQPGIVEYNIFGFFLFRMLQNQTKFTFNVLYTTIKSNILHTKTHLPHQEIKMEKWTSDKLNYFNMNSITKWMQSTSLKWNSKIDDLICIQMKLFQFLTGGKKWERASRVIVFRRWWNRNCN